MAINRAPFNALVDDDGTGTTGTPWNKAQIKSVILDPTDAALVTLGGTWAAVPFNVANFWPGVTAAQVTTNCYVVIANTLIWLLQIANAPAPTPASAALPFVLPIGRPIFSNGLVGAPAFASDGGPQIQAILLPVSSTLIGAYKSAGGTWAGPVTIYFSAMIGLA